MNHGRSIFSSISALSESPAISAAAKPAGVLVASAPTAAAPAHSTPAGSPAPHVQANPAHADGPIAVPHDAGERTIWDWTDSIQIKKYDVGGSFSVLLFLEAFRTILRTTVQPDNPTCQNSDVVTLERTGKNRSVSRNRVNSSSRLY